jgi:hypothetical protein
LSTISIDQITPQTITVYLGDHLDPNEDPEKDLIGQAGKNLCLLGSYVIFKEIENKLPQTTRELLDFAEATESEKERFEKLEPEVKEKFLNEITERILLKVRMDTFMAVEGCLNGLDLEDSMKRATELFQTKMDEKKEQIERFFLEFREPGDDEVRFMLPKKGEDNKSVAERTSKVMIDCFTGHNVTNGDGGKATKDHVLKMIKKRGMMMIDACTRWQDRLPLPRMRGRSSAK